MGDPLFPIIHSTDVIIIEVSTQRATKFTVFYKKDNHIPTSACLNVALFGLPGANATQLRSDIVIMRRGTMGGYINFARRDNMLADWLMPR
jgi:hypothetical protein